MQIQTCLQIRKVILNYLSLLLLKFFQYLFLFLVQYFLVSSLGTHIHRCYWILIFQPFCLLEYFLTFVLYVLNSNFLQCPFYYSWLQVHVSILQLCFFGFPGLVGLILVLILLLYHFIFHLSCQNILCSLNFMVNTKLFANFTFVFNTKLFWENTSLYYLSIYYLFI